MSETENTVGFWDELTSPVNLVLVSIIVYLIYKIIQSQFQSDPVVAPSKPDLPKLRKDLTPAELKNYDGNQPDGRVLLAVNGTIFDVTAGKRFYGPGGPYAPFAGRDATRGLATSTIESQEKEYDDLSDLTPDEISAAKEWEDQFREKYHIVGRLLKLGETPTDYEEEEKKDQ